MNLQKLLLAFLCLLSISTLAENKAEKGVLDLSAWNYEEEPVIYLDGEWEIYWNQLIDPSISDFPETSEYYQGGTNWNGFKYEGKEVGSFGYATYRLFITNLPEVRLNIQATNVLTACKIWANGQFLTEIGRVGTSEDQSEPHYENRILPLEEGHSSIELVVQISNFHHRKGGFGHPFQIGVEESTYIAQREVIFLDGVISSCYLFAGIFFLTLWVFRKKDKTLLYMSLFCLTITPRALASGDYMVNTVMPGINWSLLVHIEYLSMFLPFGFILLFVREKYPKQAPRKLVNIFAGFMFLQALITILTPVSIFSWLVIPHQLASMFGFLLFLWIIIRAIKDYENGSYFAGTALLCLIAWAALILCRYTDIIEPVPYLMTGLQIGFLLSMSLIIGARFSANYTKVEALQEETAEQKGELEAQKMILELKNEEILSSISYAKRIQAAILPPPDRLTSLKPESFIIYLPKDIVAGDFYWIEEEGDHLFIAVADCTGHGVPGAMVSVVCNSALNRSIREFDLRDPGQILDKTRQLVLKTFEQSQEKVKDGMDISLCVLNRKENILRFAGANNSVYIIPKEPGQLSTLQFDKHLTTSTHQLFEFKGNKQPIGAHPNPQPFTTNEIPISKGDNVYMSSDGYPDQFGGEKGKKFMYKPFKQMLLDNASTGFEDQQRVLLDRFEEWKSEMEQTDDVCVMGFRI